MNLRYRDAALIKACFIIILLALGINLLWGQFATQEPRSRTFVYSLTGEGWLRVERTNRAGDNDWHPSYTIITSSYRPVVKKEGQVWTVSFRSPNILDDAP